MIEDILKKVNKIDLLVITWRYIFWSGNDSKRHFIRATVVLLSAAYKIISSDVTVESRMLIGQHPRRLTCLAISQSAISNLSWLILYIYIYIYIHEYFTHLRCTCEPFDNRYLLLTYQLKVYFEQYISVLTAIVFIYIYLLHLVVGKSMYWISNKDI
jgi:hypothetical protein